MTKVTMTLDDGVIRILERLSKELGRPKSEIARQAIEEFGERADKPSAKEIAHRLAVLDAMVNRGPTRPQSEVDAELREIRWTRRHGWRSEK